MSLWQITQSYYCYFFSGSLHFELVEAKLHILYLEHIFHIWNIVRTMLFKIMLIYIKYNLDLNLAKLWD